jgi:hypothetical protein
VILEVEWITAPVVDERPLRGHAGAAAQVVGDRVVRNGCAVVGAALWPTVCAESWSEPPDGGLTEIWQVPGRRGINKVESSPTSIPPRLDPLNFGVRDPIVKLPVHTPKLPSLLVSVEV